MNLMAFSNNVLFSNNQRQFVLLNTVCADNFVFNNAAQMTASPNYIYDA